MKNRIELRSERQSLNLLGRFIDDIVEQYPAFRVLQGSMSIVIGEAVTNAIVHGNKEDCNKKIVCACEVVGKIARFRIEDEGSGFEFVDVPNPVVPESIEKAHGRGLFIIRMLSDRLEFEDGGRVLIIEFDSSKSEQLLSNNRNAD